MYVCVEYGVLTHTRYPGYPGFFVYVGYFLTNDIKKSPLTEEGLFNELIYNFKSILRFYFISVWAMPSRQST